MKKTNTTINQIYEQLDNRRKAFEERKKAVVEREKLQAVIIYLKIIPIRAYLLWEKVENQLMIAGKMILLVFR